MPEVGIAAGAHDLDAYHAMTGIGLGPDVVAGSHAHKAGPAAAGVKLVVGVKQRRATADALVGAARVVHLAAYGSVVESVEDPQTNFEMNVIGTLSRILRFRRSVSRMPANS